MIDIKKLDAHFAQARSIFIERNRKYGVAGMDMELAISLATTKLQRLKNTGYDADSAIDLLNYAVIMLLLGSGEWVDTDSADSPLDGKILIKKLVTEHNGISAPQKTGDVGFDLAASEEMTIPPIGTGKPVNVPCGFGMKIPDGYWAEIRPRSSTATKLGITVYQSVMDNGYTGPWYVVCHSITGETIKIEKGTRIAQCIFHKMNVPALAEVDVLPETERGATGFGSSGLTA